MKMLLRNATIWFSLALLGFPAVVQAQVQVDHTTFTTAITATATSITLTAASGSAAGEHLYVEGELLQLQSAVNASTTEWNVRRGLAQGATPARAHPTTAIVWVLDAEEGRNFNVAGTCTAGTERFLPFINTRENRIYDCSSTGFWVERDADRTNVLSANTVCGGKLTCREEFNGGHAVMQDDGTAKSLTDAEENFVYGSPLGPIEYREEQTKTASSWVAINGELDISGDNATSAEGVEIVWGAVSDAALNQVIEVGTNGACISAMITVADISAIDELVIGWRQNEAFVDAITYETYDDYAIIGIQDTAGDVDVEDEEAAGGVQNDDAVVVWADGERRALKVCMSSGGVPTFYYTAASPDNEAPLYVPVTTTNTGDALTAGDGMVPFLGFLISGTDGPNVTIQWVQLEYAP